MENQEAFEALYAGRDAEVIGLAADSRDFGTVVRGSTLLGLACELRRWDLVRPLLALGANPNGAEGQTRAPLLWAIEGGDLGAVRVMLDKGAKVNAAALEAAKNDAKMLALVLSRAVKPSLN